MEAAEVTVDTDRVALPGLLSVPDQATGVVVFAHGSGSSRFSTRNAAVAAHLNGLGQATLLFDLLTPEEASDRSNVFDIDLLADRLDEAGQWTGRRAETSHLRLGFFGASTGAAAALQAAARRPESVGAVVSRGGRPDLAGPWLASVQAPTMLIVGGADYVVIDLNRQAEALLRCERRVEIVPGATHLFEEPGALEQVAELAGSWFARWLTAEP